MNNSNLSKIFSYFFRFTSLLYSLIIIGLSVMPTQSLPKINVWSADKWVHILVYAILSFLLFFALKEHLKTKNSLKISKKSIYKVIFLSLSLGFILEFIQGAFLPYRTFEYLDLVANAIGAISGGLIGFFFLKK